jgi:hypothetical protein
MDGPRLQRLTGPRILALQKQRVKKPLTSVESMMWELQWHIATLLPEKIVSDDTWMLLFWLNETSIFAIS